MKKEFVPYDIALAMKELGFNETCFGLYNTPAQNLGADVIISASRNDCHYSDHKFSAPLYQQAFRWFREKHRYSGIILPNGDFDIYRGKHQILRYTGSQNACLRKLIEIVKDKI